MKTVAEQVSHFKPLWDTLEPFKIADLSLERGVPSLHGEIGKLIFVLINRFDRLCYFS